MNRNKVIEISVSKRIEKKNTYGKESYTIARLRLTLPVFSSNNERNVILHFVKASVLL